MKGCGYMDNFPIDINGITMHFEDISKFRKRTNKLETIKYIIHKTGCERAEAEQVADEIEQILFPQQMSINVKNHATDKDDIVRCPKCNSPSVVTMPRGYHLLWGFLGSGNPMNVCQNCGYKWKPTR